MIGRAHHLDDDRLFECYLAGHGGEAFDPPAADHLASCVACRERLVELTELFDDIRSEAAAEADDVFTNDVLRHQHDQILRRLVHINRSARVISFPGRLSKQVADARPRVAPRWLAAAAVAGLLIGAAASGVMLQPSLRRIVPGLRVETSAATTRVSAPAVLVTNPAPIVSDVIDDDLFLAELEIALERPHTRELQPFDALTPHVREIGSREP